jgi:hypothetical protein
MEVILKPPFELFGLKDHDKNDQQLITNNTVKYILIVLHLYINNYCDIVYKNQMKLK